MDKRRLWSRILNIAGLVAMIAGAADPLEGSIVILLGSGMIALGAFLGSTQRRFLLYCASALIAVGVCAMFVLSAFGGVGGSSGRSWWWAVVVLPYPVGWVLSLVVLIRGFIKPSSGPAQ